MTEKKRSESQEEGKPWTSASEKGNDQPQLLWESVS